MRLKTRELTLTALFAAYLIGLITEIIKPVTLWQYIIPASVGLVVYYGVGAVYFYLIKNLYVGEAVSFAVVVVQYCLITVLPDFILCMVAAGFAKQLIQVLKKAVAFEVQA